MKLVKLFITACVILGTICYFTGSYDILYVLIGTVATMVDAFLPAILIIGGIYILIRCIF